MTGLQLAEVSEEDLKRLEARVEQLTGQLYEERREHEAVYGTAAGVQKQVNEAIDFRRAKRAESRGYLEQMEPVTIERPAETGDGTN